MGLLADTFKALAPAQKVAVGATIPTWQDGLPQYAQTTMAYVQAARDAYGTNELIYAAIEELCTSASEPQIAAYRRTTKGPEKIEEHPILDLLQRPNPWMTGFSFTATTILHRSLAGNAYLEKVRSAAGRVVELWHLRPDRVRVIPDAKRFIRGYEYRIGDVMETVDANDVIHSKCRGPWDDYYGYAPLAVAAPRIYTDNFMKMFVGAFFCNAGVPAGLLTLARQVTQEEKEMIRTRFRNETGGPGGWHSLMVLEATEAKYEQFGMALGERGLVVPELDEINEVRLLMPFGVPLELVGARIGMVHGNRSTMQAARASFWDETLAPLYRELADDYNSWLVPEFPDVDYLEFDTSTVKALQEDADAKHARIREDLQAGLITQDEARKETGRAKDLPTDGYWILGSHIQMVPVGREDLAAPGTDSVSEGAVAVAEAAAGAGPPAAIAGPSGAAPGAVPARRVPAARNGATNGVAH